MRHHVSSDFAMQPDSHFFTNWIENCLLFGICVECVVACAYVCARHMPACDADSLLSFFFESSLAPQCPLCVTAVDGAPIDRSVCRSVHPAAMPQPPRRRHHHVVLFSQLAARNVNRRRSDRPTDSVLFSVALPASICRSATSLP